MVMVGVAFVLIAFTFLILAMLMASDERDRMDGRK